MPLAGLQDRAVIKRLRFIAANLSELESRFLIVGREETQAVIGGLR